MITDEEIRAWLRGRLPEWFEDWTVALDREEITISGRLAAPAEGSEAETVAEARGRIAEFRERTRAERIAIASDLQDQDGRKVAWAAECGPVWLGRPMNLGQVLSTVSTQFGTFMSPCFTCWAWMTTNSLISMADAISSSPSLGEKLSRT